MSANRSCDICGGGVIGCWNCGLSANMQTVDERCAEWAHEAFSMSWAMRLCRLNGVKPLDDDFNFICGCADLVIAERTREQEAQS